jgi:hypothetical protein
VKEQGVASDFSRWVAMKLIKSAFASMMLLATATVYAVPAQHQGHMHAVVRHSGHGWGYHGYGGVYFGAWWPWYYSPWYVGYAYPYAVAVDASPPVEYVQINPATSTAGTPAASAPTPAVWYYCKNPGGYYPYVKDCPAGWQEVVAQPSKQP